MDITTPSGIYTDIKRLDTESLDMYSKRCQIIIKNNPRTESEYLNIEKLSILWSRWKFESIKYSVEIMSQIESL